MVCTTNRFVKLGSESQLIRGGENFSMDVNTLFELVMSRRLASGSASVICCKTTAKAGRTTYSSYDFFRLPTGTPCVGLTCMTCGYMTIVNLDSHNLGEYFSQVFS